MAEAAYLKVRDKLPSWREERVLVVLAGSPAEFDALTGGEELEIGGSATVRTTVEVSKEGFEVGGRHMVVNLPQLAEETQRPSDIRSRAGAPGAREADPTHHSRLDCRGAAMYLAGTRQTAAWSSALQKGDFGLVDLASVSSVVQLGAGGSQAGPTIEYAYSNAVTWYLVETFGEARFWELYAFSAAGLPRSCTTPLREKTPVSRSASDPSDHG